MKNAFSLEGKTILITGAASGIGRAAAILIKELGAETILVDRNPIDIKGTENIICDLTATNFRELFSWEVQGMVHCAGVPYISPLRTINKEKFQKVWEINTWVALELTKHFGAQTEKGSVVYISSDHAMVGAGVNTGYAASKAALHGITKSLAIELAPRIRVNCIAPGFIETPMADDIAPMFAPGYTESVKANYPLGLGRPEDVAYGIAYLLSDAAKWITGTILTIDGGYTAR